MFRYEAVVQAAPGSLRADEATPSQTRKMVGQVRTGRPDGIGEVARARRPFEELYEDSATRWVGERDPDPVEAVDRVVGLGGGSVEGLRQWFSHN